MKKYLPLLLLVFLLSCDKNPFSHKSDSSLKYSSQGNPALVLVIENNDSLGGSGLVEATFNVFHRQVLDLLADFFDIPAEAMQEMTLTEIVDVFGEAWQISELEKIARSKYKKIIVLTDDDATSERLLTELTALSRSKYDIDMIFNLHGSSSSIWFSDGSEDIEMFMEKIKTAGIHIRSLYQTCCYGSGMIDDWEQANIFSVNGTKGPNSMAIFSPIFFLSNWLSGSSFKEAVERAYDQEIDYIRSYDTDIPVSSILLPEDAIEESKHVVGGLDTKLKWNQFPVEYTVAK